MLRCPKLTHGVSCKIADPASATGHTTSLCPLTSPPKPSGAHRPLRRWVTTPVKHAPTSCRFRRLSAATGQAAPGRTGPVQAGEAPAGGQGGPGRGGFFPVRTRGGAVPPRSGTLASGAEPRRALAADTGHNIRTDPAACAPAVVPIPCREWLIRRPVVFITRWGHQPQGRGSRTPVPPEPSFRCHSVLEACGFSC